MPLIKCPDCGQEISAAARACPKCGHPLLLRNIPPPSPKRSLELPLLLGGLGLLIVGFFLIFATAKLAGIPFGGPLVGLSVMGFGGVSIVASRFVQ